MRFFFSPSAVEAAREYFFYILYPQHDNQQWDRLPRSKLLRSGLSLQLFHSTQRSDLKRELNMSERDTRPEQHTDTQKEIEIQGKEDFKRQGLMIHFHA